MSKGHATVRAISNFERFKYYNKKDWINWGLKKSVLKMFGNNYIPGIKTATGSLGHGIGFATGMAFFFKVCEQN